MSSGSSARKTSSSASSPNSPTARSPTEDRKMMRTSVEQTKHLVHRSNSSPEMESWKHSYVHQNHQIQEQDEAKSTENVCHLEKQTEAFHLGGSYKGGGLNNHLTKGGTTSPYRGSYEAIPEEVIHKDGPASAPSSSPTSGPIQAHSSEESSATQEGNLVPVKRDRINTVSVMSGPHARNNNGLRRIVSVGSGDTRSKMSRREYDFGGESQEPSGIRSGMSPGFVFLQLCQQGLFGKDAKPLLIPPSMERSIKVCYN